MDLETQFWLTWWVNVVAAVATFLAVVLALFGDYWRAKLFRPQLVLELVSALGNKTPVEIRSEGNSRQEMARYYHVRLRNETKWPHATQAQVYLVRVEEPGPDGSPQIKWSGDIPLKWQWHEIYPLQRTVGPEAVCDLCNVVRGKWLSIATLLQPTGPRSVPIASSWRES